MQIKNWKLSVSILSYHCSMVDIMWLSTTLQNLRTQIHLKDIVDYMWTTELENSNPSERYCGLCMIIHRTIELENSKQLKVMWIVELYSTISRTCKLNSIWKLMWVVDHINVAWDPNFAWDPKIYTFLGWINLIYFISSWIKEIIWI